MIKSNQFPRGFIVVAAGVILGVSAFLFIDRKQVPAKAQAQELFTLYFEMDHVRQESAQILTELMLAAKDPSRIGAEETLGSKPPLSSREELEKQLQENQISVKQSLEIINANKFTDPEVDSRYDNVYTFYTTLFEFENMVLTELSLAENDQERYAHLATTLYEEGTVWPALLAEDAQLMDALASLADLHGLEFTPLSYEELSRKQFIELNTPIISDEVNTITYPFTVNGIPANYAMLNISFDIPLSDKIQISLEDPHGRSISEEQLAKYTDLDNSAELNHVSYIYRSESVIIIKLFPEDLSVMPIPGEWKLYVTAPVGSNMVIGMIEL